MLGIGCIKDIESILHDIVFHISLENPLKTKIMALHQPKEPWRCLYPVGICKVYDRLKTSAVKFMSPEEKLETVLKAPVFRAPGSYYERWAHE